MPEQIFDYEVSGLEVLGTLLFFLGLIVTLVGLWKATGGLRVIVSGRIDERRRSANSLKRGVIILAVGVCLLFLGMWFSK